MPKQILQLGSSIRKLATLENGKIVTVQKASCNEADLLKLKLNEYETLLLSVRPDLDKHLTELANLKFFDKAKAASLFQITGTYPEIGADRLANLIGAIGILPQKSLGVLDLGTCTTYTSLKWQPNRGDYELSEGFICPGLGMSLQALHWFTASLPQVQELEFIEYALREPVGGKALSAKEAVCKGVLEQSSALLKRIEEKCSADELSLFLTGGWSELIASRCQSVSFIQEPNLALLGAEKYFAEL